MHRRKTADWFGEPRSLETFFDLACTSNASSEALAFLTDGAGFTLVLQRQSSEERYPDDFHFGFLVDEPEEVHAFHTRADRTARTLAMSS